MRFRSTDLDGVVIVDPDIQRDPRGAFLRTFCREEFAAAGLSADFPQCNLSSNARRNTLRGMHYQSASTGETKLVRCVRGAIFDVVIDVRKGSPSYLRWAGIELSEENARAIFIPAGLAHGFQSLTDNSAVYYHMGAVFNPAAGRGVRWNDPAFGVVWPLADPFLSERDAGYPDFVP